ncbi:glycosyltransferase [Mucilaginibacter pedocola]|uniref:Glycosyl transferase family 1 domain-containing protein n=1 Tax=Mucilaginibacter pedocola TaxID=1792845 RepID=A0A1S9P826_9SPHI|nr:glycosyltransferase [Mucilaginibacter pedocola]OOQ57092.1 hypothetical protein BC343_16320 [Mucilaginibacter pedocola]
MEKKIYLYPMRDEAALKAKSPYVAHLSGALLKHFKIVNYGNNIKGGILDVTRYFFKANIFYFNWIENTSVPQICFFFLFFAFAKVFGKKVVWAHHNVHPHRNNGKLNRYLIKFLAKHANYVVLHTTESLPILQLKQDDKRVVYFFHPFFASAIGGLPNLPKEYDLLIWGNIRKSKGVDGFMQYLADNGLLNRYKINITGKFESEELYKRMSAAYGSETITINNKFISAEEMDMLHAKSRFVFFPYTGSSVLNSGALLTSLPKGIPVIGPNVGGFKEMGQLGFIATYNTPAEVLQYVDKPAEALLQNWGTMFPPYFEKHSWSDFGDYLNNKLK